MLNDGAINNNLTRGNKEEIISWSMPDNYSENLTLGTSGTAYTAPANGFFSYDCSSKNAGGYVKLLNTNTKIASSSSYGSNGNGDFGGFIPAKKGDSVTMKYNYISSWVSFVFIYCDGDLT